MEHCYARRLRRPSPRWRKWMRRSDACSPPSAVDWDPKEALSHEESMNQQKITEAERTQDAPALSESSHQTGPFADAHIKQSHVRFSLPPLPPVELCVN